MRVLDIASNKSNEVTKCAMGALYVCPESDWLVIQQYEGQLKEGQVGARPTHLYCVKKDGSGEKRLDYPKKGGGLTMIRDKIFVKFAIVFGIGVLLFGSIIFFREQESQK